VVIERAWKWVDQTTVEKSNDGMMVSEVVLHVNGSSLFQWNTQEPKLLCGLVTTSCKNVTICVTTVRAKNLGETMFVTTLRPPRGIIPLLHLRNLEKPSLILKLNTKIDLKYLPIPALTFSNPSKSELLSLG
jgi:hypothetical protein